ncbi:CREB/ATF bZIP transcription factor [Pleurodeles waltl]|uniref:CREB/ATF bZIP transcription factor n=1 Tax=Pleurodeles waltl TaxID=8319 RepID=UPI0037096AD3
MRATRSGRYRAPIPRAACGDGGAALHEADGPHLKQGKPTTSATEPQSPTTTMSSQSSPGPGDDMDFLSSMELAELLGHDHCWDAHLHKEMWNDDSSVTMSESDTLPFGELLQQLVRGDKTEDRDSSSPVERPHNRVNGKNSTRKLNGAYEAAKTNKNALAARLNRLRKKEYVMGLEEKVSCLSSENVELKEENRKLGKRVHDLEEETKYLKAVLANESVLSQLLGRLTGVKGMMLTTSLFRESGEEMDHDYALPRKRVKVEEQESTSGGICLHVDKEKVSVEFCSSCARNACSTVKILFFR